MNKVFLRRDFALASSAYFFVFLSAAVFYLYPLFLDQFHPSKSRVGLIMGIHSVTAIIVRPLFGGILDAKGGRKVAIAGFLIMIASMPGFHLVQSAGILALLLRAVNGIGWGIATTAILAICSDLGPPDRMAHSLGVIGAAGIVAQAVGPMLAEEILLGYSFGAVFNVSLVLLLAALLCLVAIREAPFRKTSVTVEGSAAAFSAYPTLVLLIIAAMPIIHGAVRGAVINFIALFGAGAGFGRIGPFFLVFSMAAIITRLGFGDLSDRFGRKRIILPAALLIGLNLFWIAGVHSYWAFLVTGFLGGLGQGLIFPPLSTYVIDFLGRANKGLALGIYLSLFDIGMGLGSPLFGWISDVAGYRRMYAIAGCLILVLTAIFGFKAPRARPEPVSRKARRGATLGPS